MAGKPIIRRIPRARAPLLLSRPILLPGLVGRVPRHKTRTPSRAVRRQKQVPLSAPARRGALCHARSFCAAAAFLVLLAASRAWAGGLDGVVRDEHGLLIAGAQVRVSGQDATGGPGGRRATSDSQGRFQFDDLPAGVYEFEAYAAGFERKTIAVELGEVQRDLDVQLAVAGVHEGIVVTATRQEQDSTESPLPAALISRERLSQQLPVNLAQALDEVPGITWVNAGAFSSRPVIRGLDSNRILVLVDGERLNNGRTSTVNAGIETALVDVSDIEQVELVRGPGSVLHGSDALGGVLNIRTRSAMPSETFRMGLRTGASFFPNSDGQCGSLEASAASRWFSARLRGSAGGINDYSTPAGTVFGSGVDESGALGDLRVYPVHNQSLSFKYLHRGGYNFGLPSLDPNPVFLAEFPFSKLTKFSGGYQGSFQSPLLSSLHIRFYTQQQARDFFNRINAGPSKILSDTVTDIRSTGFDLQASSIAARRHVLTYGVTYYRDRNRDRRFQTMVTGNRVLVLDDAPSVPNSTFSGTGIFLQHQYEPLNRVRLVAGVRLDHFALKATPTQNFNPTVSDAIVGTRNDTAVSGNAGASIDIANGWTVSGNLGRAFREPNLFERFFFGRGSVGGFVVPNPALEPETSVQLDTGLHFRRGPAKASVNYFRNNLSDLISSARGTFNGSDTFAGQPVSQNVNIADARIQGLEASSEFALSGLGAQWTPIIAAAWQRGTNRTDNQPLPLVAPFVGQAGLRWSPRGLRVWSEGRARIVTGSERVPAGFNPIPASTVFTWRGGYELVRGERGLGALLPRGIASVNFHASIENLANRLYRGLFETVPQPGRDFRFGIDLNLDTSAR